MIHIHKLCDKANWIDSWWEVMGLSQQPGLPLWLIWWRIHLQCRRARFDSWVGKIPWRRDRLPISAFLGFPCGSDGKKSACNEGDLDLIPGLGRLPGEAKNYPLQYSGLENSNELYSPWGHKESNTTEQLCFHFQYTLMLNKHSTSRSRRKWLEYVLRV